MSKSAAGDVPLENRAQGAKLGMPAVRIQAAQNASGQREGRIAVPDPSRARTMVYDAHGGGEWTATVDDAGVVHAFHPPPCVVHVLGGKAVQRYSRFRGYLFLADRRHTLHLEGATFVPS